MNRTTQHPGTTPRVTMTSRTASLATAAAPPSQPRTMSYNRAASVTTTTTAGVGLRVGPVAPAKPGVADPLKLVKVDTNPLSQQAKQTLDLLEKQNAARKEILMIEADDPNVNWESALSSWKSRRKSASSYQPKVLELVANPDDELAATTRTTSTPAAGTSAATGQRNHKTFRQLLEQKKERGSGGSYMYEDGLQSDDSSGDSSAFLESIERQSSSAERLQDRLSPIDKDPTTEHRSSKAAASTIQATSTGYEVIEPSGLHQLQQQQVDAEKIYEKCQTDVNGNKPKFPEYDSRKIPSTDLLSSSRPYSQHYRHLQGVTSMTSRDAADWPHSDGNDAVHSANHDVVIRGRAVTTSCNNGSAVTSSGNSEGWKNPVSPPSVASSSAASYVGASITTRVQGSRVDGCIPVKSEDQSSSVVAKVISSTDAADGKQNCSTASDHQLQGRLESRIEPTTEKDKAIHRGNGCLESEKSEGYQEDKDEIEIISEKPIVDVGNFKTSNAEARLFEEHGPGGDDCVDDDQPPPLPSVPPPEPKWSTFPSLSSSPPSSTTLPSTNVILPGTSPHLPPHPVDSQQPLKLDDGSGGHVTSTEVGSPSPDSASGVSMHRSEGSREKLVRQRFEFLGLEPEKSEEYGQLRSGDDQQVQQLQQRPGQTAAVKPRGLTREAATEQDSVGPSGAGPSRAVEESSGQVVKESIKATKVFKQQSADATMTSNPNGRETVSSSSRRQATYKMHKMNASPTPKFFDNLSWVGRSVDGRKY